MLLMVLPNDRLFTLYAQHSMTAEPIMQFGNLSHISVIAMLQQPQSFRSYCGDLPHNWRWQKGIRPRTDGSTPIELESQYRPDEDFTLRT
jgi:hypothetical protein